jgi:maltooligosyltrehalose synthase
MRIESTATYRVQFNPQFDFDGAAGATPYLAELGISHVAPHAMLEQEHYRLAFWRAAGRDLGYRRFFDINILTGDFSTEAESRWLI